LFLKGLVNSLDSLPNERFIRAALLYDNEEVIIIRIFFEFRQKREYFRF